ncbi:MAG: ABC transporter permease subunit [Bdellovibrionales bacterium]|nr:ABC transporter permease subunit [Bdellovibrionales bacterium]
MNLEIPKPIRYLVATLFLTAALFYPFYQMISIVPSLLKGREFVNVLLSREVCWLAWITFRSAFIALAITFGISFSLVALLSRTHVPLIRAMFETTWIVPGLLVALVVLGGQKHLGIIDRYGLHAIIIAWVIMGVPYLTLGWLRAIDDVDDREIDLYRTLGATKFKLFTGLLLRKSFPMVQSLMVHQFYWYLVSFSLVGVLGGGPPNETLEVAIYSAVHYDKVRTVEALCYAIWQIFLLAIVRGFLAWISVRAHLHKEDLFTEEWNSLGQHQRPTRKLKVLVIVSAVTAFLMIVFNPDVFDPVIQGVVLATASSGLSIGLSMFLMFFGIDGVARSLAWISPMIFSLAWWRAYALEIAPSPNREWMMAALVVAVQALLFLPWALRFLGPIYRRARGREIDAMRTLGAGRFKAWRRIEWPRVAPDTRFLFSVIWSFALSEVSTVILFSKGGFEPLGVWVQNQLLRFRIHEAWIGTFLIILLSILMIQSRRRKV